MANDSEANRTDIQIPRPVTVPDLVSIILEADLPRYPFIKVERDHPGITIHEDLERLPDHVEANATVHIEKVNEGEETTFGDWPILVRKVQWQASRQPDLTIDAESTIGGGFKKAAYPSRVSLRGGSLSLRVETSAGKLNVRYQSDGTVYLTVGFALPEESAGLDDVRKGFALPHEWTFEAEKTDEQQVRSLKRLIRDE